jgi:purine-binding chemotaxis protein CheW
MKKSENTVLVFLLDGETFALPIDNVLEIVDPVAVTPVPHAPKIAPGLVNVRGTILPLFDIRHRLGLPPKAMSREARMVVFDAQQDHRQVRLAFLADAVERVLELEPASIGEFPELCALWPAECLAGAGHQGDTLIVRLSPETVFQIPEAADAAHDEGAMP